MDRDVLQVQMLYPRIYMACHADHVRAASSEGVLSARDSTILAHLAVDGYASPSVLAKHLNVTRATLSEALTNLEQLDYVTSRPDVEDERRRNVQLTGKGLEALSRSSVLDYKRLKHLLGALTSDERRRAIEGLSLLAGASSRLVTSSEQEV
jgi:DNA-binding MarR family transcriptional regulator